MPKSRPAQKIAMLSAIKNQRDGIVPGEKVVIIFVKIKKGTVMLITHAVKNLRLVSLTIFLL